MSRFFRRGRFDQLDEPTSPFNLEQALGRDQVACLAIGCPAVLPVEITRHEPAATLNNGQGGLRFNTTSGKVDWSVAAYRGLEPFGLATAGTPAADAGGRAGEYYVSAIHDAWWGLRNRSRASGAFAAKWLLSSRTTFRARFVLFPAHRLMQGLGVDRQAGAYRISGTALLPP